MVDAREQYIASQAPRKKWKTHPARSAQALRTSGAGIVHRNMMDLQRQMTTPGYVNNQADLNQLKDLRRDWNRNRKYTDAGMAISGASTPLEAQDAYVGMSRDLRQGNNPAYTNMYPISGNIMNYADKGGLWGAILSEIGNWSKDRANRKGILGTIDDTPEEEEEYIEKTFGAARPNMYDVAGPWFGTAPIDDVTISDLPDEPLRVQKHDWVDDITETDTFSNLPHHSKRSMFPRDNKRVIPGYGTTYIDMEESDIGKEEVATPAIIPFNDANREAGIAALYGQGPMWGETNRRLEGEYRDYIERTGDKLTYEEFEGAWERLHALPRGLHYQEPRAGIR